MLSLIQLVTELDRDYPDWREWGLTPLEAATEAGLIDDLDLALLETPELEFDE